MHTMTHYIPKYLSIMEIIINKTLHFSLPLVLLLLLLSSQLQTNHAVQYIVTNNAPATPGGARFDTEIGTSFTLHTMKTINEFIWKLFQQPTDAERKNVRILNLYISNFTGANGYTNGDNINITVLAIQGFPPGRVRYWFTSLLYHEMTIFSSGRAKGLRPGGLTEGVADYIMIKSGYYDPVGYTKPGQGNRWDAGYGVTARFLEYCDSLRDGFTVELNNKMREVYRDEYFMELLGKPLGQVWAEYKAKYGNIPAGGGGGVVADVN